MPVVIKSDSDNTLKRTIIYIIIITIIVVLIIMIYKYVIVPYTKGTILPPPKVPCSSKPDTPTNITAYSSRNRAIVQWNPTGNTDNYVLYVGLNPGFNQAVAERTITVYGNNIAVLNLIPDTYYFKVVAINSCGTSAVSNEISLSITEWPSRFKLCKKSDPRICLLFQSNGSPARTVSNCDGGQCDLTYQNLENIKSYNDNICLFEDPLGLVSNEVPVKIKTCESPTTWNLLNTTSSGRIVSSDNLCLGAPTIAGGLAYNTLCSVISNPDDERYSWVIQATTN